MLVHLQLYLHSDPLYGPARSYNILLLSCYPLQHKYPVSLNQLSIGHYARIKAPR